ncbi:MAG: hypothetical protein DBX41_03825 [Clostridiales bacterium]|nr:MAG: hypothetical protein DBX41_03825 [Clostridiales bacterium]
MPSILWLKDHAYCDANLIMDLLLANGNSVTYPEMLELYRSVYKWALAKETDDQLLMDMALDDNIPLDKFIKMYDLKYTFATDDAGIVISDDVQDDGVDLEDLYALQNYLATKEYLQNINILAQAKECFQGGWVYMPNGKIVKWSDEGFKETSDMFVKQHRKDTNFWGKFWTWTGLGNTMTAGLVESQKAVEKENGKLNKEEAGKAVKNFAKPNSQLLTTNILKYAGHANKAYDAAHLTIVAYGDFIDDGELGVDTFATAANIVASGAAMTGIAIFAAGCSLPAARAAIITIATGYVIGLLAEKGVEYLYTKKGQKEAEELSKNIVESLYNNPEEVDNLLVELAAKNEEVAEILKREGVITDAQVGEYIKGEKTDTPTHWLVTTTEYGLN